MARKRAYTKRMDYRKGGRVTYQRGGMYDTEGMYADQEAAAAERAAARAAPPAPAPTTPTFTQAQIDEAVASLNAGTMTPAQVAQQYGVTEDFVTSNLASINAQRAASGQVQPTPVGPGSIPNIFGGDTLPDDNVDTGIGGGTPPVVTQPPQDTIVTLPVDPVVTPPGGTPTPPGGTPTPPGGTPATPTAPSAEDIAKIPADGDYSQFEIGQVVDALNAGTMTIEQVASQFGATPAQVRAELARINQFRAGEEVTGPDPFEGGVYEATKNELKKKASVEQLKNLNLTRVDDPATKVDESTLRVPGSFIKDYQRVDTNILAPKRTAEGLDVEEGITADADVEKLSDFVDIPTPTGVDDNDFAAAKGNLAAAVKAGEITPADYGAFLVNEINNNPRFAQNLNRPPLSVSEIRQLTERAQAATFDQQMMQRGMAQRTTDIGLSDDAFVPQVAFREDVRVEPTKEAEKQTREAITGEAASSEAARITDTIDYESYKRREVTGRAAKDAAVSFTAEAGQIQPNLARTLVEDPAKVTAQIENEEPEVIAAVAALPEEALVSSQMETLLAGMETGEIPVWARPAYDAVNSNLARRGFTVSTVGRDALFNAIIQSAIPIAQSNAQALQARAAQNLSNEQQANLQQAQLSATQRLNNLANRQTAESQSAQFAQNLNVLQSQFNQERDTLSFQQQQQTRLQNLQNAQRTAELNNQSENAFKAQSLGNEQQVELANLQIKNQTEQQNMTAENQERLAEMQIAADFMSRNAAFAQQMQIANLSADQQTRLANLSAQNQADAQSLTAAQQTELANLNARMQTNLAQGRIAQTMGVALLSADQQAAVTNATTNARLDLAKFSDAQQVELANSRFMQTATLTDFNANQQAIMQNATALASLDATAADQRTRLAITQAQNFLQRDMANLSNEQQAIILNTQQEQQRLLSNQAAENASRQFNATSENQVNQFFESLSAQIDQFNATQNNAMEQFNATEANRVAAINAGNAIDAAKFNNNLNTQIAQFNEQYDLQREQWNAANAQAIEQSNIQWRRQANTIDTAATNAANQENAARSFNITSAEQNFIWQSLRDEAAYLRQGYENNEQRKTTLYATAISNDVDTGAVGLAPIVDIVDGIID